MTDGGGESVQHRQGLLPREAGIGDAATVDQRLGVEGLVTADEMAFQHDAGDGGVSRADLLSEVSGDGGLLFGVFAAVGVTAVDHDEGR